MTTTVAFINLVWKSPEDDASLKAAEKFRGVVLANDACKPAHCNELATSPLFAICTIQSHGRQMIFICSSSSKYFSL